MRDGRLAHLLLHLQTCGVLRKQIFFFALAHIKDVTLADLLLHLHTLDREWLWAWGKRVAPFQASAFSSKRSLVDCTPHYTPYSSMMLNTDSHNKPFTVLVIYASWKYLQYMSMISTLVFKPHVWRFKTVEVLCGHHGGRPKGTANHGKEKTHKFQLQKNGFIDRLSYNYSIDT